MKAIKNYKKLQIMDKLNIDRAVEIVSDKFNTIVDLSDIKQGILPYNYILKVEFENSFVAIRENDSKNIEVTFFTNVVSSELYNDASEIGITFYPNSVSDLKTITNCIDV